MAECPQCNMEAQNSLLMINEAHLHVQCPNGHITNVHVKFKATEIIMKDGHSGALVRYDKLGDTGGEH